MFHLASTRFNNETLKQNMDYRLRVREKKNERTKEPNAPIVAYYGSLIKVHKKISVGAFMFVFEMNNELNRIEGISLVRNTLVLDKRHKIYTNEDYNRYIYRSIYWLSRDQISELDPELVETFDLLLFKGKTHMKRACGITVLNEKLLRNWDKDLDVEKNKVRRLFLHTFTSSTSTSTSLSEEETNIL
jgi:hypothetical protein